VENYADIFFIDEVRALQERAGSADKYQRFYSQRTKETLEKSDLELCGLLSIGGQPKIERVATIDIIAADWNCPKYIPQMIAKDKVDAYIQLQMRNIIEENEQLKAQLEKLQG